MSSRSMNLLKLSPLLLAMLPVVASATIFQVPSQKPTIQAAIDAAITDDVVQVAAGTYAENIDFKGKAITVIAVGGRSATIIDGQSKESVVRFTSSEGPRSVLSGFTLRNGQSGFGSVCFGDGGGICIQHSSPTIRNNTIENNAACEGAGISIQGGSPLIQGNRISHNNQAGCSGGTGGGGIDIVSAGAARIIGNVIENNAMGSSNGGGGISLFAAGRPTITGNILRGNSAPEGGAIWMVNESDAYIGQNLIMRNSAGQGAGVYWLVPSGDRGPFLVNDTIVDNLGDGVFADGFDVNARLVNNVIVAGQHFAALDCGNFNDTHDPVIHANDIFGAAGTAYAGFCADHTGTQGNISADPLFVSRSSQDYHLTMGSPAIDAGTNNAPSLPAKDFDGALRIQDGNVDGTATVDMGAYEVSPGVAPVTRSATAASSRPAPSVAASDRFERTTTDRHRTAYAFDTAGHLVSETDPKGLTQHWK